MAILWIGRNDSAFIKPTGLGFMHGGETPDRTQFV